MNNIFDAIVVGAGFVGASVAYHLCTAGVKTALFDRGLCAAAASGANFGNIQIMGMELEKSVEMVTLAAKKFDTLEQELDYSVGLRRIGGLLLIQDEERWHSLEKRLRVIRSAGIQAEMLQADRLREIEPLIAPAGLLGGFYHAREGQVDPFRFIWGHLQRARQRGLKEFYNEEVIGFKVKGEQVEGIQTAKGITYAETVVLCTGARTRLLAKMLGRDWGLSHILGQAMVTEPVPPVLHNYIASASFFKRTGENAEKGKVVTNFSFSQSPYGHLLLGEAMYEADHFRKDVPYASLPEVCESAARYFPSFRKLRVLRSWSTPVAHTADNCPLLGPVAGLCGLILATAFQSTVIIAPLIGEAVMQLVTSGKCGFNIAGFSPERGQAREH
ncbi:MAG: FAD-binding oxidoreductase [Anaerolineae bacterium]|nr:FAD-binding oxidoreductase [Anaerolineae bacterium]